MKTKIVLISLVLALGSYLLPAIAQFWYADVLYARAQDKIGKGMVGEGIKDMQQAVALHPGEPNYYNELAQGTALMAASLTLGGEAKKASEAAESAIEASDKALKISPRSVSLLKSRAVIMNQLAIVDEKYLYEGINTLEKAALLAPTDPKIHYNLGVLYERAGDRERAIEILEKALELKPDYEDPKEALETLREE